MDQLIVINQPSLIDSYANELALFFKLYERNFPDIDEREDPQIILDRIKYVFSSIEDNGGVIGAWHKDGIRWMAFLMFSLIAIIYIIIFARSSIKKRD